MPKLLHFLRDPFNHCSDLQCCWQPESSNHLAYALFFSYILLDHFLELIIALQVAVAVLVSWLIFRNPISPMNAIGCAITLVGCTFYGYVRHLISQQQAVAPGTGSPTTSQTNSPRSRMEMLPLVGDKQEKV